MADQDLHERNDDAIPRGMHRPHDVSHGMRLVRGKGSWVWDEQGRRYLDWTSSFSSLNFGHAHPSWFARRMSNCKRFRM